MKVVSHYVRIGRQLVIENNIDQLEQILGELNEEEPVFDFNYLFQKLFLAACFYGNQTTIFWFLGLYKNMNELDKLILKQALVYGKYVTHRRKDEIDEIDKKTIIMEIDAVI